MPRKKEYIYKSPRDAQREQYRKTMPQRETTGTTENNYNVPNPNSTSYAPASDSYTSVSQETAPTWKEWFTLQKIAAVVAIAVVVIGVIYSYAGVVKDIEFLKKDLTDTKEKMNGIGEDLRADFRRITERFDRYIEKK